MQKVLQKKEKQANGQKKKHLDSSREGMPLKRGRQISHPKTLENFSLYQISRKIVRKQIDSQERLYMVKRNCLNIEKKTSVETFLFPAMCSHRKLQKLTKNRKSGTQVRKLLITVKYKEKMQGKKLQKVFLTV